MEKAQIKSGISSQEDNKKISSLTFVILKISAEKSIPYIYKIFHECKIQKYLQEKKIYIVYISHSL